MAHGDLDGFVAVVTGGSSGLGTGDRRGRGRARRGGHRHQLRPQSGRRRGDRCAASRRMAPRRCHRAGRRRQRRGLQEDRRGSRAVRPHRRALQQRRPDHLRGPRRHGRGERRELRAHLRGERDRPVPDDPRRALAAGGRAAAGRGRQHRLDRWRHRHRLVGALCRLERRADHHDAVAGPGAGAQDPRQRALPRLHRHALVRAWPAGRRGRTACARTRPARRRCSSPPSRRTSPAARSSSPRPPRDTSPARRCWSTPARTSAAPRSACADALRSPYADWSGLGSIPCAATP